jgi:hypothetical protein
MISIHLMGGLGNQLFQIFTTIAYSLQTKVPFIFPYSEVLGDGIPRPTYWNSFFSALLGSTTRFASNVFQLEIKRWPQYREPHFHYKPLPTQVKYDFMLFGYFQSWRYFADVDHYIRDTIKLSTKKQEVMMAHGEKYFANVEGPIAAMHFRLGDYKFKQEFHPVASLDYYGRALAELTQAVPHLRRVLYFCEAEDHNFVEAERIAPLRERFPLLEFVRVDDGLADWEQLLLMSHCHHFIIANSSFSWWGAWFGDFAEKRVYYPSVWFGPAMGNTNTADMCPPAWFRIG